MAEYIIIKKAEYEKLNALKTYVKEQVMQNENIPTDVISGLDTLIAIENRLETIDLNATSHILTDVSAKIVNEFKDILEDGKVSVSDLDDGWMIWKALEELLNYKDEVLQELGDLNKDELATLTVTVFSEVYNRIKEFKNENN